MNKRLFENLRADRTGCPSDLHLDRLIADELSPEQAARAREHLGACPACEEHVRAARFDAMPQVDAAALLSRIRARAGEPRSLFNTSTRSLAGRLTAALHRWARPSGFLTLAGVAGVVAVLIVGSHPPTGTPAHPAGFRDKGGPTLRVHRMVGDGSEEVLSGARLAAGERLRFIVDLPRDGYTTIVGVEERGGLYRAWPTGTKATAEWQKAGRGQVLPGAVALDDAPGKETLYLVLCAAAPASPPPPPCQSRGPDQPPRCQDGCQLTPFVLNKASPKGPGR